MSPKTARLPQENTTAIWGSSWARGLCRHPVTGLWSQRGVNLPWAEEPGWRMAVQQVWAVLGCWQETSVLPEGLDSVKATASSLLPRRLNFNSQTLSIPLFCREKKVMEMPSLSFFSSGKNCLPYHNWFSGSSMLDTITILEVSQVIFAYCHFKELVNYSVKCLHSWAHIVTVEETEA